MSDEAFERRARELYDKSRDAGQPTWIGLTMRERATLKAFAQAVRREALEEAARACESVSERRNAAVDYEDAPTDFLFMAEGADEGADECAEKIRALLPATKEGNGDG